jgi:hypothetical protein
MQLLGRQCRVHSNILRLQQLLWLLLLVPGPLLLLLLLLRQASSFSVHRAWADTA